MCVCVVCPSADAFQYAAPLNPGAAAVHLGSLRENEPATPRHRSRSPNPHFMVSSQLQRAVPPYVYSGKTACVYCTTLPGMSFEARPLRNEERAKSNKSYWHRHSSCWGVRVDASLSKGLRYLVYTVARKYRYETRKPLILSTALSRVSALSFALIPASKHQQCQVVIAHMHMFTRHGFFNGTLLVSCLQVTGCIAPVIPRACAYIYCIILSTSCIVCRTRAIVLFAPAQENCESCSFVSFIALYGSVVTPAVVA